MLPQALKCCPKSNKSSNLVTLIGTHPDESRWESQWRPPINIFLNLKCFCICNRVSDFNDRCLDKSKRQIAKFYFPCSSLGFKPSNLNRNTVWCSTEGRTIEFGVIGKPRSYLVVGDEGCLGPSCKLLCLLILAILEWALIKNLKFLSFA